MNMYYGTVVSNEFIGDRYYHMKIHCSELAKTVLEGQIIHVQCGENKDPFLRRPFSIYRYDRGKGIIELMYIIKGKGTEIMGKLKKGDRINLLGPVGKNYEIHDDVEAIAVIGRGVGIASIISLAEKGVKENKNVIAILSARNKEALIGVELLKKIGCKVFPLDDITGNSSVENVKKILENAIDQYSVGQIYTCGSNRIGRLVKSISDKYSMPASISLEEHMACGIGICYGCVCKTKDGYKTVCKDGPVFDIQEVEI